MKIHGKSILPLVLLICVSTAFSQAPREDKPRRAPSPREEDAETSRAPRPAPTQGNVKYGLYDSDVLDFWKAKSDKPTPLVIYIHGGGFRSGSKTAVPGDMVSTCLKAGVSVASINYRLSAEAIYPAQMQDGARAVQFLRSKAKEWNLDPARFAASGSSAGAGMSLWLAFHDDMADPKSQDPVARESTRLVCAAVVNGQCSYDPRFIKQNIPGDAYKHGALIKFYGLKPGEIDNPPPDKIKLFEDASSINHLTAGDPPVFLSYGMPNQPPGPNLSMGAGIHHPKFGQVLKEKMDVLKIECVLHCKGDPPGPYANGTDFMIKHLTAEKPVSSKSETPR